MPSNGNETLMHANMHPANRYSHSDVTLQRLHRYGCEVDQLWPRRVIQPAPVR
jgi:hypothetical protein